MSKQSDYVMRTVEERGIRFIRLWFTDVLGFLKSVAISPAELEVAFEEGMTFDGSSIDGYARIQEADMLAKPDPTTFAVLPWRTEQQVARMFCDIHTPDGEPFPGDPRTVLKRNLENASEMGYTFYTAPELEFFYFEDSGPEPKVLDHGGYFDRSTSPRNTDGKRSTLWSNWASRSSTPTMRWRPASTRSSPGTPTP
jgi:glutamine synthetase